MVLWKEHTAHYESIKALSMDPGTILEILSLGIFIRC